MQDNLPGLIAANDQEHAECKRWMRENRDSWLIIWEVIQVPYEDTNIEIMSRFAQLAFSEMAAEVIQEDRDASH